MGFFGNIGGTLGDTASKIIDAVEYQVATRFSPAFQDYDMVVALTQKTINDELARIFASGVYPNQILLQRTESGNSYTFRQFTSPAQPTKAADGSYADETLNATYSVQIEIVQTGTKVNLVITFTAGEFWCWVGVGPKARLTKSELTGWTYKLPVQLDLSQLALDPLNLDPSVKAQLQTFTTEMFGISTLFSDLSRITSGSFQTPGGASQTSGGVPVADAQSALALFMTFYLHDLAASNRPFLFGFSVTAGANTKMPGALQVPLTLLPVGTTFTVYHDQQNPELSSINYILATKGCHEKISGTPPNFTTSLFFTTLENEGPAGQIAYSHAALVEPLILKPIFEQIRTSVFNHISGSIATAIGNDFDAAMTRKPAGGWSFHIQHSDGDLDKYFNDIDVSIGPPLPPNVFGGGSHGPALPPGTPIPPPSLIPGAIYVKATIYVYKEHTVNMGFGTARSWASANVELDGIVQLVIGSDGNLAITSNFKHPVVHQDSGHNFGGSVLGAIGDVLGGLGTVLTFGQASDFLSNAFIGQVGNLSPGVGSLQQLNTSLSASAKTTVVQPSGAGFVLQAVTVDPKGNAIFDVGVRP